jgi:hypothetical protein
MSKEKFTAHRYPSGHLIGFSITAASLSPSDVVHHAIALVGRPATAARW